MTYTLSREKIADYQAWERSTRSDLPGRYSMGSAGTPVFNLYLNDVPVLAPETEYLAQNGGWSLNAGKDSRITKVLLTA